MHEQVAQKFHTRYTIDAITGCWLWQSRGKQGTYGWIRSGARVMQAHRLSWELHNNYSAPREFYICHACNNTQCVNPDHLYLGTPADNAQDRIRKAAEEQTALRSTDPQQEELRLQYLQEKYAFYMKRRVTP